MRDQRAALIVLAFLSSISAPAAAGSDEHRPPAIAVDVDAAGPPHKPSGGAAETAGLLGPAGPKDIACKGIRVQPGARLQEMAEAAGPGAAFCLQPGLYPAQHVSPLPSQSFTGLKGAVLDGRNGVRRAFDGTARDVVIRNLVIRNYTAGNQDAAVYAAHGRGWRVLDNEICCNAGIGVSMGVGTVVSGNSIHHNAQSGYGTAMPGAPIVENNEIAFNNDQKKFDPAFEAGGGKITLSDGAVVRHNWVHDNQGPGIWSDIDNTNYTAEWNLVENNCCGGIFHEISWTAAIRHNVVRNNSGDTCPGWLWCAGIIVAASGATEGAVIDIAFNTIVSDGATKGNGIALIQQSRQAGKFGTYLLRNISIHDNTIDVSAGGSSGAVQDTGDLRIFSDRSIRMDRNIYIVGPNRSPFSWANETGGRDLMTAHGQELSGTFR
ncbi:right-handed parallel beta-helix repeat-containing protein [Methylobacterium sp. J-059]|uniref:right-handed parallel beta-helix repeat-containing protein n=1 Tax=Methylobacterium sp. J-059 TaxID=2836643 RepID=UPI001FBA920F|nr:right-handed parallel beta-helix repeat-containing protein [Methylobacterium sp. J-059]